MAKKRRTRQQKIIARLRRQLSQQKLIVEKDEGIESEKDTKIKVRTPAKISPSKELKKIKKKPTSSDNKLFFYNPDLLKKDLSRTVIFSLVILALIGLFYWGIEIRQANTIREFFRL